MILVSAFEKISGILRKPTYLSSPPSKLKIAPTSDYKKAILKLKQVRVFPGWTVFFWNRKQGYVDHIAMVVEQGRENLNLYEAKLVHGSPPPIGKTFGPLALSPDYSGIRVASVRDYIAPSPDIYSRIIVGHPPSASKDQIVLAGKVAQEVNQSGILLGKPAFYSFPILKKFLFVSWFNYKTHNAVKLANPRLVARKRLGGKDYGFTYCGDMVGQIYQAAGIKNLPQAKILCFSGYRSSTFYEWEREKKHLEKCRCLGRKTSFKILIKLLG